MGIVKTLGQEEFTSVLCIMLCEVMSDAWKWLMVFVQNMIFRSSPFRSLSFFLCFNVIQYRNFPIYYCWLILEDKSHNSTPFHIVKHL
jgi:hypothetical protein